MMNKPEPIRIEDLSSVTGGCAACAQGGAQQQPQAASPSGMAPPKYSAGWWDFVRSRGAGQ